MVAQTIHAGLAVVQLHPEPVEVRYFGGGGVWLLGKSLLEPLLHGEFTGALSRLPAVRAID